MSDQSTPPQPPATAPPVAPPAQTGPGSNGLATAGFVLGLVAVLGCWIPLLNILAMGLGVLGAVLAGVGLAKSKRVGTGKGLAIAGIALGLASILIAIIINVAFANSVDDALNDKDADVPHSTVKADDKGDEKAADEPAKAKNSFVDGVLTTDDVIIKITDHKVIPPGKPGNKYGDKPIIAFQYEVTNVSGKETDASSSWIFAINAFQDNDPNAENELDMAITLDLPGQTSGMDKIKKGGTVKDAIAYELDDLTTPVDLVANDSFGFDDDLGKVTYNLQ